MAWTPVLPPGNNIYPGASTFPGSGTFTAYQTYPELMLEWAPTSKPTDATQMWVDITDRLRDWSWGYGRNDELARFDAGSGSLILDNRDRALDPSYAAGPYYGSIKPRRKFRLRANWAGTIYPVFEAHARGFPQTYPAAGFDSLVQVDLIGTEAILQGIDLVVGFTRSAELSSARIGAVLDAVGIPAGNRDIDTGTVTTAAINVTDEGVSGLDHARTVAADSEFGQLFAAKDGKLTFHNRHRRLNVTSSLHTFGDGGGAELPYGLDFQSAYDETYLWNYVRVTGPTGDPATASDTASDDDYHTLVRNVDSQLEHLNDRQALAEYMIFQYAQPEKRVPSIPLNGAMDPATLWPVILDLEVSDRVTVKSRPMGVGAVDTLIQNVEGIRHSCKPGGPWVSAVGVSPADESQYWFLGTAGLSELGTTTAPAP